jgi:putative SOS response-associated peptidase YedK
MCGRYSLSSSAELVREVFALELTPDLVPRWNIAPTQEAPVVRREDGGARRLAMLRWGLLDERAAAPNSGQMNGRSETVDSLAIFRDSFRRRRCLVPADGFYEWKALEGTRHPFHIRRHDRAPLAFAGVWGRWQRGRDVVESFTILTTTPNDLVRPLHDRMPVILPRSSWELWLLPHTEVEDLRTLLVPSEGAELEAVPVSPYVNRADHEGAECLRVVPAPVARQLSLLPP